MLLPDLDTAASPPLSGPPTAADLAVAAPLASASAQVRQLAADLKTPVRIFEYLRNHFVYEPYFGAVKGADRTIEERAGNDVDIASALISVLRAAGVPCRYVYGTIRLTRDQAASWLGVAPETVPDLLAAAGIPFQAASDTAASDILLDHVWVAAWIDYLPYRGSTPPANSASGTPGAHGDFWIEIDPSFKQHAFTPPRGVRDLETDLGLDAVAFLTNIRAATRREALPASASIANASSVPCDDNVTSLPQNFILGQVADAAQRTYDRMTRDELTLDTVFRRRVILDESCGLLPCTDLYRVETRGGAWATFPDALTARVFLTVSDRFGHELLTWNAPQAALLDHRLALGWTAAADADRAEIQTWIDAGAQGAFPAWRVRVLPRLLLDGQSVAQGAQPIKLGTNVRLDWRFLGAGADPAAFPNPDARRTHRAVDLLPAGALAAFVFDAGRVTDSDIENADAALTSGTADLGQFLDAVGRACLYQADRLAPICAGLLNLFALRRPSLVRVSTGFDIHTLYGLPFTLEPGPVDLRIVRSAFTVSPLSTPDTGIFHPGPNGGTAADRALAAAVFPVLAGLVGSTLAANTLRQMTGADASSPLQLLAAASAGSIAVVSLAPTLGPDGILPAASLDENALDGLNLDLETQARTAVLGALNQGAAVVFPRTPVPALGRRFEAIIAVNPADGATDLTLIDAESGTVRVAGATAVPETPPAAVPDLLDPAGTPVIPAALTTAAHAWLASVRDAALGAGVSYVPALAHVKNFLAMSDRTPAPGTPPRPAVSALKLTAAAIALWGRIDAVSKQPAVVDVRAAPSAFSPDGDGVNDIFTLEADVLRADDWTVRITDAQGRELRTFTPADNLGTDAGNPGIVHIAWNGSDNSGATAPDGPCRWTITAQGQGSAAVGNTVVLDAAPPDAALALETRRTASGTIALTFRGTADDANLDAWTLEIHDAATDVPVVALDPAGLLPAAGNLPVINGVLLAVTDSQLPNGTYVARLTVTDKAGNTSIARTAGTFTVDHPSPDVTPPEITLSGAPADPDAGVLRGSVPVTVSAADAAGVASLELHVDGKTVASVADSAHLEYTLDCTALDDGVHTIQASAADAAGNVAHSAEFTFLSSQVVPDVTPPSIEITAPLFAGAGTPVHVVVRASDNHDLARIDLRVDGANSATRAFPQPTLEGALETDLDPVMVTDGTHRVEIRAEDRDGNRAVRLLSLPAAETTDATPPAVALKTSADSATAAVTGPVQVHVTASDASGIRQISLVLDGAVAAVVTAPVPALLDAVLTPATLGDGAHTLTARAVDAAGNVADSAPLHFSTDNPVRAFSVTPDRVVPGLPGGTKITVDAQLREALDWRLCFHGPGRIPEITGHGDVIHVAADAAGVHDGAYTAELMLRGHDRTFNTAFVVDLVTGPPVAEFIGLPEPTPLDDGTAPAVLIRDGMLALDGTADDPDAGDAVSWKIELVAPDGSVVRNLTPDPDASGRHVGRVLHDAGDTLPSGAQRTFGTIDLTLVPNGVYTLVLTVYGGADSATASARIVLDSQLKVGAFRFSQQDLTVPAAGFAITVVRSYDSLDAETGESADFGPGWRFAISDLDVRLDETRADAKDTDGNVFSKRSGGGRNVTLTLPDGRRATFLYCVEPAGWFKYRARWKAPPGVYAALTPTCSDKIITLPGLAPYWEAAGPETPLDNFEFPGFVLTLKDGTRYVLDRPDTGAWFEDAWTADTPYIQTWGTPRLRRIELRNGSRLEFRADGSGVDHYTAQGVKDRSVVFERDARDRITAIYSGAALDADGAPTGPAVVTYEYDAQGNLWKVHRLVDRTAPNNPAYRTVEYEYNDPDHPHYITGIKDPRGRLPLRAEYDADGRLVALVDAEGNRTTIDHDLGARIETVTDRLGNPTTYVYDARGNVVTTVDALGNRTTRTYDDAGNELTVTDPLGHTVSYTWDANGNRTSVTDPLGNTTTYTYDAYGNVLSTTDPLGNTTTNTYDAAGNLVSTVDALGNAVRTEYDPNGNPVAWFDAEGNRVAEFAFDGTGNLAAVTDAAGVTRNFSYDADGNQTGVSWQWVNPDDPADVRTVAGHAVYDAAGQLVEAVDPDGNTSRTGYNALGKPERVTDKFGNVTEMTYDARGNLVQTLYPDGTVARTVYDENGRAVVNTNRAPVPGGRRRDRDAAPPATMTFPVATRILYDALGRVVRTEQLRDAVIKLARERGRDAAPVMSSRFISAAAVISAASRTYDAAGRVIKESDAAGAVTRYEYDDAGRRTALERLVPSATRGEDLEFVSRTEYEYDAAGRRVLVRGPDGAETRFAYDALGRTVRTILPTGAEQSVVFDKLGRRIAETDADGNTRNFEYDVYGRLTAVVLPPVTDPETGDAVRPRYEYEYDAYGRLRSVTDPKGRITRFTADSRGRRTSRTLPMGQTENSHYDRFGRLAYRFDFKGQLTHYVYDALGRIQRKQFFSAATLAGLAFPNPLTGAAAEDMPALPAPDKEISYTYDALGRRSRISVSFTARGQRHRLHSRECSNDGSRRGYAPRALRVTNFTYDDHDRLLRVDSPEGTVHYEYDPATGRRIRTWTANTETAYAYDALGRLVAVTATKLHGAVLTTPRVTTYTYTADDRKDAVILPNGVTTLYDWDGAGRLTKVRHFNAARELLASFEYTLAPSGRRLGISERIRRADDSILDLTVRYTYDALNRLTHETSECVGGAAPAAIYSTAYTYDLCGNRVRVETDNNPDGLPETVEYAYNANDQLVTETSSLASKGVTVYDYDANGSLTSKQNTTTGEHAAYTYDPENRLAGAVVHRLDRDASGVEHVVDIVAAYRYDAGGFRIAENATLSVDGGASVDRSRAFLPDAENPTGYTQVLEESTAAGLDRSYIIGDRILAQNDALGTAWLLPDGHGSTRLLTDSSGSVTDRFLYDAWGNLRTPQPTGLSPLRTSHLYTGEHFDSFLGLQYLRARWYAPTLGAFTRMDPATSSLGIGPFLHNYSYALGTPTQYTDPSGKMTLLGKMVVAGIIGAFCSFFVTTISSTERHGWDRLWYIAVSTVVGFLVGFGSTGIVSAFVGGYGMTLFGVTFDGITGGSFLILLGGIVQYWYVWLLNYLSFWTVNNRFPESLEDWKRLEITALPAAILGSGFGVGLGMLDESVLSYLGTVLGVVWDAIVSPLLTDRFTKKRTELEAHGIQNAQQLIRN